VYTSTLTDAPARAALYATTPVRHALAMSSRRAFLVTAGVGAILSACRKEAEPSVQTTTSAAQAPEDKKKDEEKEVTATEDLMREHGVIRRVLVVYREAAARMRAKPGAVPLDAIQTAAKLIRSFGEDYHEKQLEEAHLFPALVKKGGAIGGTVSTLIAQHQRGREITDYVVAQKAAGDALARTLEAFARMYEAHAAMEDTIVFPAWKEALSAKELDEMGERFEEIEHKTFGKDGFDDAVDKIAAIEKAFGIDLAALTAPPPPKT
jgi:hemerythrin-like domain-containing protein